MKRLLVGVGLEVFLDVDADKVADDVSGSGVILDSHRAAEWMRSLAPQDRDTSLR